MKTATDLKKGDVLYLYLYSEKEGYEAKEHEILEVLDHTQAATARSIYREHYVESSEVQFVLKHNVYVVFEREKSIGQDMQILADRYDNPDYFGNDDDYFYATSSEAAALHIKAALQRKQSNIVSEIKALIDNKDNFSKYGVELDWADLENAITYRPKRQLNVNFPTTRIHLVKGLDPETRKQVFQLLLDHKVPMDGMTFDMGGLEDPDFPYLIWCDDMYEITEASQLYDKSTPLEPKEFLAQFNIEFKS